MRGFYLSRGGAASRLTDALGLFHLIGMLRQAKRADIPAMHRIRLAVHQNQLSSVVTEENYVPAIQETGRGWVVEVNRTVVAFAVGNEITGNIWALFVEPTHEGHGCGRRLHDTMVEWLFLRGLKRLWLSTQPKTRAERFYESAGWLHTGILANGEASFELYAPAEP